MKINFTTELEIEIMIRANYSPERQAPLCSNHDSPRYGDPGDCEELEFEAFFIIDDKEIAIPDEMYALLEEKVLEICRNKIGYDEADYIEGMMRKSEGER